MKTSLKTLRRTPVMGNTSLLKDFQERFCTGRHAELSHQITSKNIKKYFNIFASLWQFEMQKEAHNTENSTLNP